MASHAYAMCMDVAPKYVGEKENKSNLHKKFIQAYKTNNIPDHQVDNKSHLWIFDSN